MWPFLCMEGRRTDCAPCDCVFPHTTQQTWKTMMEVIQIRQSHVFVFVFVLHRWWRWKWQNIWKGSITDSTTGNELCCLLSDWWRGSVKGKTRMWSSFWTSDVFGGTISSHNALFKIPRLLCFLLNLLIGHNRDHSILEWHASYQAFFFFFFPPQTLASFVFTINLDVRRQLSAI